MSGDGGKGTVLIVDDEKEIADLVAVYLEAEGYQTQVRYDAAGALEAVADPDIAIDLAVLDVMLPDMNGFHLCREIRKAHRWPIIMLTARDDEVDKITGLNFGADDYVTKPSASTPSCAATRITTGQQAAPAAMRNAMNTAGWRWICAPAP